MKEKGSVARVTTVHWVPESSVRLWVHENMRVLQSAWWRFCSDAQGVYLLKEDGARVGQPGQETVHHLLRHARSEVVSVGKGGSGWVGRWQEQRDGLGGLGRREGTEEKWVVRCGRGRGEERKSGPSSKSRKRRV